MGVVQVDEPAVTHAADRGAGPHQPVQVRGSDDRSSGQGMVAGDQHIRSVDPESVSYTHLAVDEYIPEPERATDKPFLMPIEDVFTITGRGTVVTGRVERGVLKVNEEVEIVGIHEKSTKSTVTGVEMFRKLLDQGQAGDNVGVLLRLSLIHI